ncbi:MAG: hypothetical protein K9N06_02010 [Candidatus Cloacimonetes bacterium]|nr:hypothetical protein [Candidatus Cloacimonadota bacterium]
MKIVIFDDEACRNFYPLTYTRATGDLRAGVMKLRQRVNYFLDNETEYVIVSENLKELYRERHPDWKVNYLPEDDVLLVNSRTRITRELAEKILNLPLDHYLTNNKSLVAVRLEADEQELHAEQVDALLIAMHEEEIDGNCLWNWLWELIAENGNLITQDFNEIFADKDNSLVTELGVTVLDPYNCWIGEGAVLKPGVVIDASGGPVIIDEGAEIMPNAVIIGPVYIGKKTRIKIGARIYQNNTFGPDCRIGGEVEGCIIQGFSNKQHDGFLGHCFLGEWVNLGAGTNNSDLKNNYQPVSVHSIHHNEKLETGMQFLGALIGDHCKTGINSTINSGSVIGFGCNIYGETMVRDYIPNLRWGQVSKLYSYQKDKFLETVERVKSRRGLTLTDVEKELYIKLEHPEADNDRFSE